MIKYLIYRIVVIFPTLLAISVISFTIIMLPPGDFLDAYIGELMQQAGTTEEDIAAVEALRENYGLTKSIPEQYFIWLGKVLRGDFGQSFFYAKPVSEIIWERTGFTILIAFLSIIFTWAVAFPLGFYSAVRQYSIGDYLFTFLGFLGLAIPSFLFALVLMYAGYTLFGVSVGGLFSSQFVLQPWSVAKFVDMLKHLWIPVIIVGTAGAAPLIRVMRNNLLDELNKPYVVTARARGLNELRLMLKYPVRIALNPFISTVGWVLPEIFSGATIVSVVLSLPTSGAVLLDAMLKQDMYLAGAIIMMMAVLTVVGTLISDILLAAFDPRIRYGGQGNET